MHHMKAYQILNLLPETLTGLEPGQGIASKLGTHRLVGVISVPIPAGNFNNRLAAVVKKRRPPEGKITRTPVNDPHAVFKKIREMIGGVLPESHHTAYFR